MQLSVKNRWLDADGKVYIYFSQEQIAEMMGCGLKKVGSLLAELDSRKGIGLITRIRQGLGKPDRIYVRRCICVDLSEGNIQTRQNDISGYIKMADTDMSKVPGNDTDKNKTEINDTEYLSFLSADESEESRRKQIEREAYVRVDLYEEENKVFFGELTFYHFGGFTKFEPDEWDYKLGEFFDLKSIQRKQ